MRKYVAIIGAMVLTVGTVAAQQEVPKVGAFLGYTYTRFNSSNFSPSFSTNGGNGQFIYNFNGWISGVFDAGATHNGNISRFGVDGTFVNFLAGPRVNFRRWKTFTPYIQSLYGGIYSTTSLAVDGIPVDGFTPGDGTIFLQRCAGCAPDQVITSRFRQAQVSFAMTAGGGLDIRFSKHVSFRPFEVSYYMTRLKPFQNIGNNRQDNLRASAGFTFLFGGEKAAVQAPPPAPVQPKTKTCPNGVVVPIDAACPKQDLTMNLSANNRELCPGDSTPLMANVSGAGANPLNYTWTVNGQPMAQSQNFEFSAAGRDPGTYTISATAVGDNFNPASAETTVTVLEYKPPTGTVQANPPEVEAGERSSLSASFTGQCGGPIGAPSFDASEGSIQGDQFDSSTVRFDPTSSSPQRKTVTITAKAADNKSAGTATTTIEVTKPAVIAAVRLPDVLFDMNSARVNNCGKRVLLEQLRAYSERDPGGTVVLVGHASSDEKSANLAQQRAMNAAAVITAGSGVCLSIPQSQVQISAPGVDQHGVPFEAGFCRGSVRGASTAVELRRVEVWFVPAGGQLPASVSNSQAASALGVSSLGCPK